MLYVDGDIDARGKIELFELINGLGGGLDDIDEAKAMAAENEARAAALGAAQQKASDLNRRYVEAIAAISKTDAAMHEAMDSIREVRMPPAQAERIRAQATRAKEARRLSTGAIQALAGASASDAPQEDDDVHGGFGS